MVHLQRSNASNPRKRPPPPPPPPSQPAAAAASSPVVPDAAAGSPVASDAAAATTSIDAMVALLADAGCTVLLPPHLPPSLPSPPLSLALHLSRRLSSDPSLPSRFLAGFAAFVGNHPHLRRVLVPATAHGSSLTRVLLSVPSIQPLLLQLLLEKLPEHFGEANLLDEMPLREDVGRLILNQFRWLDFLVDADGFVDKLVEVLSIAPPRLKREIIGSLPEIVGDQSHAKIVAALERLLQEDSEVVVAVLDSFSDLNLDQTLQEQAVTIAISCIRTIDADQMPHLLRFLLLSATPANARRIISQVREQLKFVGVADPRDARSKKLKGKAPASAADGTILETLRSSLRFKNMLCEAFLKELKSVDNPRDHKVIDVWLTILIYANGGALQKSAEKILKCKILQGCIRESLFDQCIHGNPELVKDHFASFLAVSDYLLGCKEERAREFASYLFTALFEEFSDTYSRQELVGALLTHIGSGVSHEASSALDIMILLASNNSEELIPLSSHVTGILDYLEGFHEDNLRKVYEIFCHLALAAGFNTGSGGSSIANELLMVVRKQVSNPDMKYMKMGIIGTLRIVSTLADVNASAICSSSQRLNPQEALELLKMALNSCKSVTLALILLYDELIALLESTVLHSTVTDWVGDQAAEFASLFLSDLNAGQLPVRYLCDGIEGELWMNLDGNISPVCVNIVPLVSTSPQKSQPCLQILPSQFRLLTVIQRLTNQGSLGGIYASLGCPLHLPSPKHLDGASWLSLSALQKRTICYSLYYAINWIRELLSAFSTQVAGRVDSVSQKTRNETAAKLLKRVRNLILLEGLLNGILKNNPLSLPELRCLRDYSGSTITHELNFPNKVGKDNVESTSFDRRHKGRKGTGASDKLNPDGKLKQPTILDSFKRGGLTIIQETNRKSSQPSLTGMMSKDCEREATDTGELGSVDLMAAPVQLDMQRFKFRPLHVVCLSLLNYSECEDLCSSDPESELPLYLYLLRDLNKKLDCLNPPSKSCLSASQAKPPHGHCPISIQEFLNKIRPLFSSLRKHLDAALSMTKDRTESCPDNWNSHSSSAGNPHIPYLVVSKYSIATSVFKEVLGCYRKLLAIPDLFNQTNPILQELLQSLQPTENFDDILSEFHTSLVPGDLDYLYCGTYVMFEAVMDPVCSFSYLLASDVLITMQSVLSSVDMLLERSLEANGKDRRIGCSQKILPFLRKWLGRSAHKLLNSDLSSEDTENGWQNKGNLIQKILQTYIKNSESTSDLLDELACRALPQVPSCKTRSSQEATQGFPSLCSSTITTWYRVLHEENNVSLNKIIKQVLKTRAQSERAAVHTALEDINKSVKVFVSLVRVCKIHEKVAMHAVAVKHGGRFVDTFLKAFSYLETHFEQHREIIVQMLKALQKATRIIQTICSEAKGYKRTMITSKVPATKRSMERFLFHVKALLHSCSNEDTFWIGNLKHKDLHGHEVSSQVYGSVDDTPDEAQDQMETDSDPPADNDDNIGDEAMEEESDGTPANDEVQD